MALLKLFILPLLCCVVLKSAAGDEYEYTQFLQPFFDYLKSNPNRVYDYKRGFLLFSQFKSSRVVEVSVEVEAECNNRYPDIPCNDQMLICNAFMGREPDYTYRVLGDVRCHPRFEPSIEETVIPKNVAPVAMEAKHILGENLELSNEALPPNEEVPDFVAVQKNSYCPGCPWDVNPNAPGVKKLIEKALRHIESEKDRRHAFIKTRRLQQQVVAGMKYFLLADFAQTICPKDVDSATVCSLDTSVQPFTCGVEFIDAPWKNLHKKIISNTCTMSQEFDDSEDQSKPVTSPQYIRNYEAMNPVRLADLESQIIVEDEVKNVGLPPQATVEASQSVADDVETLRVEPLNNAQPSIVKTEEAEPIVMMMNAPQNDQYIKMSSEDVSPETKTLDEPAQVRLARELNKDSNSNSDSSSDENHGRNIKSTSHASDSKSTEEKKDVELVTIKNVDSDSSSSEEHKQGSNSTEEKKDVVPAAIKNGKHEKRSIDESKSSEESDEGHATTIKITEDVEPTTIKNVVKRNVLIIAEDFDESLEEHKRVRRSSSSSSSSSSESDENTKETTDKPSPKRSSKSRHRSSSPDADKDDCEDDSSSDSSSDSSESSDKDDKKCSKKNHNSEEIRRKRSVGQLEKISPDEKVIVRDLADFAAATLDNIDEDHHKRVILQILGAKKLKLDGIYYQIILRLGISHCHEYDHQENCREKLFTNLTKICKVQVHVDDDYSNPKVVKSQCQNIKKDENDRNKTNYSRYRREVLVGGHAPMSTDNPKVKELLSATLNHLDSVSKHPNKHKTVDIISATSQVVAGARYVVTAKIGLSDCKKSEGKLLETCEVLDSPEPEICTIDVWDRPWLNKTIYKIKCGEKLYKFGDDEHSRRKRELSEAPEVSQDKMGSDLEITTFKQFALRYNKVYKDQDEFRFRSKVFRDNLNKIALLNKYEKGTATYGVTQFADLTETEFSKLHGYRPDLRNDNELPFAQAKIPQIDIPNEFDWRTKRAVTEVKNQGLCGSCWAFSVTGNVEGQYAIKHGKLLEFSEQELVDCDKVDQGCNGGLMDDAYRVIEKLGGLETESDYPYEGDDETCHFNVNKVEVQLTGAVNISHNETDMAKWLVQNGPISIAINANAMQFYFGGVSHPWKSLCSPNNLDHGVLIVGYGVHKYSLFNKTLPYWIVKNSWGTSWGEQGYYRVFRGDGTCGLNQTPSSAIIA